MTIKIYSARELRGNTFLDDPSVSIITMHGVPIKVTIPFDERLLQEGIARAFALHLVENQLITQCQGAKMANLALEDFLELMAHYKLPATYVSATELQKELKDFS